MNKYVLAAIVAMPFAAASLSAQNSASGRRYQLTGTIVMNDGTPVPPSTGVELTCNGRVRSRVKPYTNGDFTLLLENDSSDLPDITAPGDPFAGQRVPFDPRPNSKVSGTDEARFETGSCELRAVLPGYVSNLITLEPRRQMDKPDVGKLVLRRSADEALGLETAGVPGPALKAFADARRFLEKDTPDYPRAAQELEKATKVHPDFAAAWNLMGAVRLAQGQPGAARNAFLKSIAANPKYLEPSINLARLEVQQQRWGEALTSVDRALQLSPSSIEANFLAAFVNFQLEHFDVAERAALEVQKRATPGQYPQTYFILGTIQTERGDLESAAANLRRFLETKPDAQTAESVSRMLSEWEASGRVRRR